MTRQQFDELTAKGVVILDGATGSNLRKAGMPVGISSEQWVLENQGNSCTSAPRPPLGTHRCPVFAWCRPRSAPERSA